MDIMKFLNPQNLGQIKGLFQSYGHFLSPENKTLVAGVISEMEKGEGQMDRAKIGAAVKQISQQVKSSGVSATDLQKMDANDWQRAQRLSAGNQESSYNNYDGRHDRNYGNGYNSEYSDYNEHSECNDYDDGDYDDSNYDDSNYDEEYISDNDYF